MQIRDDQRDDEFTGNQWRAMPTARSGVGGTYESADEDVDRDCVWPPRYHTQRQEQCQADATRRVRRHDSGTRGRMGKSLAWLIGGTIAALLAVFVGGVWLLAYNSQVPGAQGGSAALAYPMVRDTAAPAMTATMLESTPATLSLAAVPGSEPASSVAAPTIGANYNTVGQPCHSTTFFLATITQWSVPPGCYATIYRQNRKNHPSVPGRFGFCNWWVEQLHPNNPDILINSQYPRGNAPIPGAAVYFSPRVQGASRGGHFAQVVAVQPGSPWILVTEMNFRWRGGGFGKVDYRYVKVGTGVTFIYTNIN